MTSNQNLFHEKDKEIGMESREPLATIMIVTYNHSKYIASAIDSVLEQKTNFDFNIHIIEDCSDDGTQDILRAYKKKYPKKIKLFMNAKNIGFKVTQKNFFRGINTIKSKYFAILEGDDLWCHNEKLQHQVDFLEKNPEYVAHAHNTVKFYDNQELPSHRFLFHEDIKQDHSIHDFIKITTFFHTTTLLYRNVLKDNIPRQFIHPLSCDIFITIAHAQHGKIRYDNLDWARYRAHSNGRFSGMSNIDGWFFNIDGLRKYNSWLNYRHLTAFSESIVKYCLHVLRQEKEKNCAIKFTQKIKLLSLFFIYKSIYTVTNFFNLSKNRILDLNDYDYRVIDQYNCITRD